MVELVRQYPQLNLNHRKVGNELWFINELEKNNELKRTETNSGSVSSYGVSTSSLLIFFHTRTQRRQSIVPEFFSVFALSVVRFLCCLHGTSFAARALKALSFFFSNELYKKPQINADERRFVDRVSAYQWLSKFIAFNPKKKGGGGMAICLPAARSLGIGVVVALVLVGTAQALSNSGGGNWQYYKDITIKENSGSTLTDYQVLVQLSGSNFPTNVRSDGADIRFTDANEKELGYWIESWDYSGKNAKIWVKALSISADASVTIRMYYGNPSASSVSNGARTFEFFDDFEDGDISDWENVVPGWIVVGPGAGNSNYAIKSTANEAQIRKSQTNAYGIWEWDDKLSTGSGFVIAFIYDPINIFSYEVHHNPSTFDLFKDYEAKKSTINLIDGGSSSIDLWHKIKVTRSANGNWRLYLDGEYIGTAIDNSYPSSTKLRIRAGTDKPHYVDNIRVRKFATLEPTLTLNSELTVLNVPFLTLTKSFSLSTITEGDSTTVTLRVENTGSDAKSVKITDAIPQGFTLVSGSTTQEYPALKSGESRTFQYIIKSSSTGKYITEKATATYSDDKGNSYTSASNAMTISVSAPGAPIETPAQTTAQQPAKPVPAPIQESSNTYIYAGIGAVIILIAIFALRQKSAKEKPAKLETASPSPHEPAPEPEQIVTKRSEPIAPHVARKSISDIPNILVSITSSKGFKVGIWEKLDVNILNVGEGVAKDIEIKLSGPLETSGNKTVQVLEGHGGQIDIVIGVKPKEPGNIPLKVEVAFFDQKRKSYEMKEESFISVAKESETISIQQTPVINIGHIDRSTKIIDSMIQRSNIGAGVRKCPKCGREVETTEKFCQECGAKV